MPAIEVTPPPPPIDITQALLARGARDAVDSYGQGLVALAQNRKARSEHLSDVASERQYEQSAADAAMKRHLAEFEKMNNSKLAEQFALMGVDTTDEKGNPLTKPQMMANYKEFNTNKATNLLANYDDQLGKIDDSLKGLSDQIENVASKSANPVENQSALLATLRDPRVSKILSDKQIAQLNSVLVKGGDVKAAISDVFEQIGKNFGVTKMIPGVHGPVFQKTAVTDAATFYQTYLDSLNTVLGPKRQIDLSLFSKSYENLGMEQRQVLASRNQHLIDYAAWIPKSVKNNSEMVASVIPPENPVNAVNDLRKPTTNQPGSEANTQSNASDSTPPIIGTRPPVATTNEDIYNNLMQSIPRNGDERAAKDFQTRELFKLIQAGKGGDPIYAPVAAPFNQNPVNLPTMPFNSLIDMSQFANPSAAKLPVNPGMALKELSAASPEEHQAIIQAAKSAGLTDDVIAQHDQSLKDGTADPAAILDAYNILQKIRQSKTPAAPNPPTPGMFPANSPLGMAR